MRAAGHSRGPALRPSSRVSRKDEPSRLRLQLKLHKAVLIARRVRKGIEKSRPPIMIAEHEMVGKLEHLQTLAQHAVSLAITAIRQVPREDAKAHALPMPVDIRDTGAEPLERIETQQLLAHPALSEDP